MKQTALVLMLILALLLFTACHTDNDPWPTGDALLSPTATSIPTEQPVPSPEPTAVPTAVSTAVPTASPTPQPTEIPGGEAAPGING